MKIVNFLGGPCSGKSTIVYGLSNLMKSKGYNMEFVHEYAKGLTWEKRPNCLADQFYVNANQNHLFHRCKGEVDWVLTDTCLLLGLIYAPDDYYKTFEPFLLDVFNSYDNINVFVDRPDYYTEIGRNQTKEEAIEVDNKTLALLNDNNIPYFRVPYSIDHEELLNMVLDILL